jgi:hypothetical protein
MFGTKKKLMTAVVMLVISAIMMTTASYAWFTISTNPEIKGLTTQVVTNENLEIALAQSTTVPPAASTANDSGNQYTWGNVIDLSGSNSAATAYGLIDKTLRPSTLGSDGSSGTAFNYPVYYSDGRVHELTALTVTDGTGSDGFGTINSTNKVYGYYVDFWLRTNIADDVTVTLSTAVKRSTGSDGITGGGTVLSSLNDDLLNCVRIAFQPGASGTITAATPGAVTKTVGATPGTIPFTGNVVTLHANEAKLVRMYVYYEGANKTNADAIIGDSLVNGSLNIQFAIDDGDNINDVDTSMDEF